jgi:hypothetical protein
MRFSSLRCKASSNTFFCFSDLSFLTAGGVLGLYCLAFTSSSDSSDSVSLNRSYVSSSSSSGVSLFVGFLGFLRDTVAGAAGGVGAAFFFFC